MAADDEQTGYAKLVGKRHVEAQNGAGGLVEEDFEALVTALPAKLGRTGGGPAAQAPGEEQQGCFVALGNIKSLSRHHATIEWDFEKGCYRISCLSKNGMVVNKVHYTKEEKAFLPHGSAVRVGPVNFYFHLPPQPGQEHATAAALGIGVSSDDDEGSDAGGRAGGSEGDGEGDSASRPYGGGEGDDDMSRASSAAAGGRPSMGRPSMGGKKQGVTYSDLVFKAFASAELAETARTVGLTSADVTAWISTNFPEWGTADRRKQLQNGVQNTLTRKFVKQDPGAPLPAGQRGARWKMGGPCAGSAASVAAAAPAPAPAAASSPPQEPNTSTTTTTAAAPAAAVSTPAPPSAPAMQQAASSPAAAVAAAPSPAVATSAGGDMMEVDGEQQQEQPSQQAAGEQPSQPMAE